MLWTFPSVGLLLKCFLTVVCAQGLELEMQARQPGYRQLCGVGEHLINNNHYAKRDIKKRLSSLADKWQKLQDLAKQRRTRLEDAAESHQVCVRLVGGFAAH